MSRHDKAKTNQILGSILSKERVTFSFDSSAKTAFVDMRTGHITFPVFADTVPASVSEHLIAHEASHVLNTSQKFLDVLKSRKPEEVPMTYAKTVFNIVEDIRIEKLIRKSYGGLTNIFHQSYKHMFNHMDMFDVTPEIIKDAGFLTRINIHYKLGDILPCEFNTAEKEILAELDGLVTKEDAYRMTIKLLEIAAENKDDMGDQEPQKGEGDGEWVESDDSDGSEGNEQNSTQSESDDGESEDDDANSKSGRGADDHHEPSKSDPKPEPSKENEDTTEENDEENKTPQKEKPKKKDKVEMEADEDDINKMEVDYDKIEKESQNSTIIDYSDVKKFPTPDIMETNKIVRGYGFGDIPQTSTASIDAIAQKTKRFGSTAANIFLSKMRAKEYATTRTHRTGQLDMNNLHKYRTSDNIFLASEVHTKGQSHGIVLFLDFSISMQDYHYIESLTMQYLNFIEFAERLKIPFQIYTHMGHGRNNKDYSAFSVKPNNGSPILLILSSDMNKMDYKKRKEFIVSSLTDQARTCLAGHTAMHSTLLGCMEETKKFKEKHNIQIMHALVMTDGDDTTLPTFRDAQCDSSYMHRYETDATVIMPDGFTRIQFKDIPLMDMTAEVFSRYVGCNMSYLRFGQAPEEAKKIESNIYMEEKKEGFKRVFYFTSREDPMYDSNETLNNPDATVYQKRKSVRQHNQATKANSLFINIFASAIAEGY